jgi:hypothetical protein
MPNELTQTMKTGRNVPPVVENAKLPTMTERAPRPRPIGGKTLLMPPEPKTDTARTGRMPVFDPGAVAGRPARPVKERPEMQARKVAAETTKKDGYVRLHVRVAGGNVSIVGARAVAGPLVDRPKLHGDLAYEVTLGSKRVALGSVPDIGVRRSFPNPDGPPEQRGHFISEVPSYEIAVRVPASEVTVASLPRVQIKLYRIKEELPQKEIQPGPIGPQFQRELREVATVKGLRLDTLSAPIQAQLKKALG